jgi:DNA polymerase-3 subunit epsilon
MTDPFLFLDCQTTGMRPTNGHLLEVAWGVAGEPAESYLVKLPEGELIPNAVREITGIRAKDMEGAVDFELVRGKFQAFLTARPQLKYALVHYAQFEKPWIEHLLGSDLPFKFLCTQKMASRVFPNSPSRSIRGILGYLGKDPRSVKRAAEHLEATKEVWWALEAKLEGKSPEELEAWLNEKPGKKAESRIQYRLEKEKRLSLPEAPGIYRMLSQSGKVLYVGKATSLKDRVNSYFRGKKGRDRKKLEMLAHVWDIETVECGSPLEAALLETDEIKRLDPPYNILLKTKERSLVFYSHDFSEAFSQQSQPGLLGPFRRGGSVEQVRLLLQGEILHGLFDRLESQLLGHAMEELREKFGELKTVRDCLALGMWMLREKAKLLAQAELDAELASEGEEELEEAEEETEEREITLVERLEILFRAAAHEYRQAKAATKLLNLKISLKCGETWRPLRFSNGRLQEAPASVLPWEGLGLADFDRMMVLKAELAKVEFRLEN